jgi:hypothetical protein
MARTIRTKVFKFNELTEDAKQNAIEQYRNNGYDYSHYSEEIIESVKAMADIFNLKFGREYSDIRYSHLEDTILQLSGVRLYKYLINNYYHHLFTPKYLKCIDRVLRCKQFICKVNKGQKGEYTMLYSKLEKDNCCVLTGVCYDNDVLQPIYDFIARPDYRTTFEDIINNIESAITDCFNNIEEWVNSSEFIADEIVNNDYEFTADGRRF